MHVTLTFLALIQDFLIPAWKFDTGTAGGAGDKFEVCDGDGGELGEGHDGNDSDDDDKDDNDDDNDIGAFRLSRERIRSNSGRMCGEGEFYTLS